MLLTQKLDFFEELQSKF